MSIISSIGRVVQDFSQARSRYLTERSIGALPPEIRKDIGWPDAEPTRTRRSFAALDTHRWF